jgi:hypothetical protein
MSSDHTVWIRLPGLFRWNEIREIFDAETGHDSEWRFTIRAVAVRAEETLYVVFAAESRGRSSSSPMKRSSRATAIDGEHDADALRSVS